MIHIAIGIVLLLTAAATASVGLAAPGAKSAHRVATNLPPLPQANPRRAAEAGTQPGSATQSKPETAEKAQPLSPEAEFAQRLDAAIAAVRATPLSSEDAGRLREAIKAVAAGDIGKGRSLKAQITNPVGRKLVEWYALRNGFGEAAELKAFADANPAWPDRELLLRRAEEQLFVSGGSSQMIKAFFADREPQTGPGYAALASAYLFEKDEARAMALAAKAWREYELPSTLEVGFLERFKPLLTEADHKRRLDRILVDSVRFSAERSERAAIAKRMVPLLSADERKKAEVRIAVFLKAKASGSLLAGLPAEADGATDWGLVYQRLQFLRSTNKTEEVWKVLQNAPTDPEKVVSPDDWWVERRAAAYAALRSGKADIAYALVRDPGPLSVNPLKDATFLAGWLALRYLNEPKAALAHFEASLAAADGPLTRSRADYWLGRTLEALGRRDEAMEHYAAAAKLFDTFHGQLARHKLDPGPIDLVATLPRPPTDDEIARFNALDAAQAVVLADKADLTRGLTRALLSSLRYHLRSEGEMAMLAHLAEALDDTQMAIRIGKTAIARGFNLVFYAYPTHAFPKYKPLREPPETALLLGIARQESEFNTSIVSTAGARGILQVMPITARHICRDHKIKCDIGRLLKDKSYNAMIGSAYVGDRMAEFSGNYVLTLAGYNAGPGRTREWIRAFGDPRSPKVDPIDWIELIPFEETREYVKKVLSNVQIYRARLGEPGALRLTEDLQISPTKRAEAATSRAN